jgi:hypothetical protein
MRRVGVWKELSKLTVLAIYVGNKRDRRAGRVKMTTCGTRTTEQGKKVDRREM